MIDLHTHILPELDDGAGSMEESIQMVREAASNEVRTIVASPHLLFGSYDNTPEVINLKVEELKGVILREKIEMEILPGQEVYLIPDLLPRLKEGKVTTINNNGRYLLLELPMMDIPLYLDRVIFDLATNGIIPIIAHPERNLRVMEDPGLLSGLVKNQGILVQLNAGSLIGRYGKRVKETAGLFVKEGLAHILASDYHSSKDEYPLRRAVEQVAKLANNEIAQALVTTFPLSVIEGKRNLREA